MSTVQVWGEVVLEMPWHVETSFFKKCFFFVKWKRHFVFCQEKGAFLFFFPNPHPSPNFTFLFLDFSLLFLSLLRHKNVSNPPEITYCMSVLSCHLSGKPAGAFFCGSIFLSFNCSSKVLVVFLTVVLDSVDCGGWWARQAFRVTQCG